MALLRYVSFARLAIYLASVFHAVCVVPVVRLILVVHVISAVPEAEVKSLGEGSFSLLSVHNCASFKSSPQCTLRDLVA